MASGLVLRSFVILTHIAAGSSKNIQTHTERERERERGTCKSTYTDRCTQAVSQTQTQAQSRVHAHNTDRHCARDEALTIHLFNPNQSNVLDCVRPGPNAGVESSGGHPDGCFPAPWFSGLLFQNPKILCVLPCRLQQRHSPQPQRSGFNLA